MGFMDKMKDFVVGNDDRYDEEGYYEDEEQFEEDDKQLFSSTSSRAAARTERAEREVSTSKSKYVNINANSQLSVVLVKPENFAEATSIADHLNEKRTVVLNLESASKEVSRRLVGFLSGAAYANNGTLKRVANCTFIITPNNVDIMGDELLEDFEAGGMYI